jgi:hypothetical protein
MDALTFASVLVLSAIVVGTTLSTVYATNATFGAMTDYVTLALTAIGSSSFTGIVATALLLEPKTPGA